MYNSVVETALKIASVAVGGAFGAVARHLINISPLANAAGKFPLPTFVINVVGSFLIGLLFVIFGERMEVSENVRLAIFVGFLGAFTTFSTFEMEIFALARERLTMMAILYLVLSVVVGFVGVSAGVALGRRL
ncbi:MAG: fluoride efflux transporter CrcB [Pyrinomonadaceae bacterium]